MRSLLTVLLVGCATRDVMRETGGSSDGACGGSDGTAPPADFASALEPSGCQYRITAIGDDVRLLLDVPVFADALTDGSGAATYTLPDDTVRLTVEVGCGLDAGWCGSDGTASIFTTYTPMAGTITVSATGREASGDALATVTFEGVSFEDVRGDTFLMAPLTWTDVRLYGIEE